MWAEIIKKTEIYVSCNVNGKILLTFALKQKRRAILSCV